MKNKKDFIISCKKAIKCIIQRNSAVVGEKYKCYENEESSKI